MNNLFKKIAIPALALVSAVGFVACNDDDNKTPTTPNEGTNLPKYDNTLELSGNYEITPTVQKVSYLTNGFILNKDKVNIICEDNIDTVTKLRLEEILKDSNIINYSYSNDLKDNYVNILVGINGSDGIVDRFMELNHQEEGDLFKKTDAYQMYINNGVISILGSDLDSAFYGVNTLNEVLNFSDDNESKLLNAKLDDYAIGANRGVVEGYYGIPWSTNDRIDIMEWGSKYKMSNYMFAPKDDEYHSKKWRDLYPNYELKEMEKVAEAAYLNKVEFTWAIHPFMESAFSFDNYDSELAVIKNKFDQLYNIGVRSFAISADDIAHPDSEKNKPEYWTKLASNHAKAVNDLVAWGNEKPEKVNFQFVPTVYCGYGKEQETTQGAYLEVVGKEIDPEVAIHWTGEQVYGKLNKDSVELFSNKTNRAPMFWLNSPVNDSWGNGEYMYMAQMTSLSTDVEAIEGLLVNPMAQNQASKVAIFQALDYAWNIKAFDSAKSHEKSFYSIEEDKEMAKQLYIFGSNLQTGPEFINGWIPRQNSKESPLFVDIVEPLIDATKENVVNNKEVLKPLNVVKEQVSAVINAIDIYRAGATNQELVSELDAHMKTLKDQMNGALKLLKVVEDLANGRLDKQTATTKLAEAKKEIDDSQKKYMAVGVAYSRPCQTGELVLKPFFNTLHEQIKTIIEKM